MGRGATEMIALADFRNWPIATLDAAQANVGFCGKSASRADTLHVWRMTQSGLYKNRRTATPLRRPGHLGCGGADLAVL